MREQQHTRAIWERSHVVITIQDADMPHPESEDMDDIPLKRFCPKEANKAYWFLSIHQSKETRLMQSNRVRTNQPQSLTMELTRRMGAEAVPHGVIRRASAQTAKQTEEPIPAWIEPKRETRRPRVLLLFLTGAILALILILLGNWVNDVMAHWHYGDSYVSTLDVDVGHSGTSHFLAFYQHDTIVVVEFSSDFKTAQTYTMKVSSPGSDHYAVTLVPQLVDGRHDLLILVDGNQVSLLYNTGNSMSFTPPQ